MPASSDMPSGPSREAGTFSRITPEYPASFRAVSSAGDGRLTTTGIFASASTRARLPEGDSDSSSTGLRPAIETSRRARLFPGRSSDAGSEPITSTV